MSITTKKYFKGLNELRAFAAYGVVLHHIEAVKVRDSIPSFNNEIGYLIHHLGKSSVTLFFVLSGFLITYLLLFEKENNSKIDIAKFYLRRMYRIWPLYYFIFLISFFLVPVLTQLPIYEYAQGIMKLTNTEQNYTLSNGLRYLFFLPQFGNPVIGATQSWSIGVEEQFYLIIPLILVFFKRKWFIISLIGLIIIYVLSTLIHYQLYDEKNLLFRLYGYFKIQFLTIGAIGGYLYFFYHKKVISYTKSKIIYVSIIFLICLLMSISFMNLKLQEFILAILFMLLILFTINENNSWAFRNKTMSYLGKISYGIYMYHAFVLIIIFPMLNKFLFVKGENLLIYNLIFYSSTYVITTMLSMLSYRYFEEKFIRIKNKKFKTI